MPFKVPTVFIVGAGAHVDYGMPTGDQLRSTIISYAEDPTFGEHVTASERWLRYLDESGSINTLLESRNKLREFSLQLGKAGVMSVDEFLENRTDLQSYGKGLMCTHLLVAEAAALLQVDVKGWHRWLFRRIFTPSNLGTTPHRLTWNNLTVVTFNYDRLLECHLGMMLHNSRPSGQTATRTPPTPEWGGDRVIHVYGRLSGGEYWDTQHLGFLNRETSDSNGSVPIRQSLDTVHIARSRDGEQPETSQDSVYKKIFLALHEAYNIVFLGFGFDETNLRRLKIREAISQSNVSQSEASLARRVYATAYGLGDAQKENARRAIGLSRDQMTFGHPEWDCVRCLSEWSLP